MPLHPHYGRPAWGKVNWGGQAPLTKEGQARSSWMLQQQNSGFEPQPASSTRPDTVLNTVIVQFVQSPKNRSFFKSHAKPPSKPPLGHKPLRKNKWLRDELGLMRHKKINKIIIKNGLRPFLFSSWEWSAARAQQDRLFLDCKMQIRDVNWLVFGFRYILK